jgi:hypothetical protein
MSTMRRALAVLFAALAMTLIWRSALAEDGCLDFKWDVTRERTLFAGTPAVVSAGKDLKSALVIVPDRLYKMKLSSQEQVTFPVVPGKKLAASGTFGGVAALKIAAAGSYRFSIDLPVWIDVVANGMLVAAKDFEGQHACSAPHKIVEFELAGGLPLILQMSNSSSEDVLLTVTPSPARKL